MKQCAARRSRSVRHLLLGLAVVSSVAVLTSSLPATSGDSRLLASSESTVDGVATVATGAVIEMTGHSPEGAVLHRSFNGTDWTEWSSLGGVLTSRPDLSSWSGGRLDVFARGADWAAWHRSRDGGVWGPWESLGGQLTSAPAAVSWGEGRIDVFGRGTDGALWWRTWSAAGGWAPWVSLGGVLSSDPEVASWGPGRLDVVARGLDNAIWHTWFEGGTWRSWESLGGIASSAPATVSWGPGRLDVFARGADGGLWGMWWDGQWSLWYPLGGVLASEPDASSRGSDRLDVFARGTSGALYIRSWAGTAWTEWQAVPSTTAPDAPPTTNPPTTTAQDPTTTTAPDPTTTTAPDPPTDSTTTTTLPPVTTTLPPVTTTLPPVSGELPAGVTLRGIDGGPSYYGQFSNPLSDDPGYFPIAVWGSYDHTIANRDLDAAAGINTYVWVADNVFMDDIRADGRFQVIQDGGNQANVGSETTGWLLGDEFDMTDPPSPCPDRLDQAEATLPDDGRLGYANYGKGVTIWAHFGWGGNSQTKAACWVNGQDVTSADMYWFTDPHESESEWPQMNDAWGYGWTVDELRRHDAADGVRQPIWNFVETGAPFSDGDSITPAEVRAAVWHSIIAGARGILYFQHSFGGPCLSHHNLRDNCNGTRPIVAQTNGQIAEVAPVLNSPFADGYVTSSGPVRAMAKVGPDGAWYVFAASTGTPGTATFTVAAGASVEVMFEGRSLPITGAQFSDTFADANAVHIYRIT